MVASFLLGCLMQDDFDALCDKVKSVIEKHPVAYIRHSVDIPGSASINKITFVDANLKPVGDYTSTDWSLKIKIPPDKSMLAIESDKSEPHIVAVIGKDGLIGKISLKDCAGTYWVGDQLVVNTTGAKASLWDFRHNSTPALKQISELSGVASVDGDSIWLHNYKNGTSDGKYERHSLDGQKLEEMEDQYGCPELRLSDSAYLLDEFHYLGDGIGGYSVPVLYNKVSRRSQRLPVDFSSDCYIWLPKLQLVGYINSNRSLRGRFMVADPNGKFAPKSLGPGGLFSGQLAVLDDTRVLLGGGKKLIVVDVQKQSFRILDDLDIGTEVHWLSRNWL